MKNHENLVNNKDSKISVENEIKEEYKDDCSYQQGELTENCSYPQSDTRRDCCEAYEIYSKGVNFTTI